MKIETFPPTIIASLSRFTPEEFFEAESEARENVKVEF
ncbi:MAG: LemA family protein [Candidatus Sungbacteria bacterium]|nr:LemA family protein [Candidatus Sungbacteria bacterium]